MSKAVEIAAVEKVTSGKGAARAMRRADYIPGIVYGGNKEPTSIGVDPAAIKAQLRHDTLFTSLFDLKFDTKRKEHVLARDLQVDPVSNELLHLDFLRITDSTRIDVQVPIHFSNEETSIGLKMGGILQVIRNSVQLNCQAASIPEYIEIDLEHYNIGDAIRISNVDLPSGVRPTITDRDFMLASIVAPKIAAETDEELEEITEEEAEAADEADE